MHTLGLAADHRQRVEMAIVWAATSIQVSTHPIHPASCCVTRAYSNSSTAQHVLVPTQWVWNACLHGLFDYHPDNAQRFILNKKAFLTLDRPP